MKEQYIHKNLFLKSSLAEELYHSHVKNLPVLDFHNHLNPKSLSTNKRFENMVEAWVLFDPYKHRAMRICGVPENEITGDASDKKKFKNWAGVLPKTIGNPLYLWSALELKRIFGIDEALSEKNAEHIWDLCNYQLQQEGFGAADILKRFNAETLCTSDDLLDNLDIHQQATKNYEIEVLPSLRGDTIIAFDHPSYRNWFEELQKQSNQTIKNLDDYKAIIITHIGKFLEAGCRLADHSLDNGFIFDKPTESKASKIFNKWLDNNELNIEEVIQLKSHLLLFLSRQYAKHKWTLQLHIGAQRVTSTRLRRLAGSAGGYAAIGNSCNVVDLCTFFDELEKKSGLPKVILYALNPADYEVFATITGSYTEDRVSGKIQFGPAWWYNDHYRGIKKHLSAISNYGLLSQFIGMTTDSRSVFSFSRHEYFRRILSNQIAEWVEQGNLPNDLELLSQLAKDVSYGNCKDNILTD